MSIKNWSVLLCILHIAIAHTTQAQDLYDPSHSQRYATHLMRSRQYALAAEEYERLHFMQPGNDTFRVQLLRAYRLGDQPERGILTWQRWSNADTNIGISSRPENTEYANLLLFSGRTKEALSLAATPNTLPEPIQLRTQLYGQMLTQQWTLAQKTLLDWPEKTPLPYRSNLTSLIEQGNAVRLKKPWVAASLSTIVPGLGKVYSRDWKDGVISLVFVGLNTWQAYRRFDREGADSVWGWIHASFGAGFYIGNIYGSHKSARLYNQRQTQRLRDETERIIFPTLD